MEECLRELGFLNAKQSGKTGGGCISQGEMYHTDKGRVFVKSNTNGNARTMFEGEFAGLEALEATQTVRVPKPLVVADNPTGPGAILVMEYLNLSYLRDQKDLGRQLALLHSNNRGKEGTEAYVDKFGFKIPTCCGSIPQQNTWDPDWVNFFSSKLKDQVDRLANPELDALWPKLSAKIPDLFSGLEIRPSLLHGDLWGGNAASMPGNGGGSRPVIFDPASFYGHDEYDLGIAGLFGGFDRQFFEAYHKIIPRSPGFEDRHRLYQLFHNLNHWNHFGAGYRGASLRGVQEIIATN